MLLKFEARHEIVNDRTNVNVSNLINGNSHLLGTLMLSGREWDSFQRLILAGAEALGGKVTGDIRRGAMITVPSDARLIKAVESST